MGLFLSTLSESNPSSTDSSRAMAPPNSSEAHQHKPESEPAHEPETPIQESPDLPEAEKAEKAPEDSTEEGNGDEGGEEEVGECGFCLFMKEGGCRETFTDWEKCVEEGEKNKEDIVEKCFQATSALRKCMEAHSDYYAPLLEAEEAAVKQLEAEKDKPSDQATAGEESGKKVEEHKSDDSEKKVTSSYGNNYHYAEHVDKGHFAFQAVEAGDYMACFFAADVKPSTAMTVEFDWKSGVAAKDWTNVAKKGSVAAMEIELKQMHDTVQSIHDEIYYLREREKEMQNLNISTNSKMAWLSFLSLLVSASVAGLQLWHLKSFFQKKKLI